MIKLKKKTKVILPIQFPMELYQILRKISFEKNVKMAVVVREAVKSYIGY
jgi:predicted DNA-binding protein